MTTEKNPITFDEAMARVDRVLLDAHDKLNSPPVWKRICKSEKLRGEYRDFLRLKREIEEIVKGLRQRMKENET